MSLSHFSVGVIISWHWAIILVTQNFWSCTTFPKSLNLEWWFQSMMEAKCFSSASFNVTVKFTMFSRPSVTLSGSEISVMLEVEITSHFLRFHSEFHCSIFLVLNFTHLFIPLEVSINQCHIFSESLQKKLRSITFKILKVKQLIFNCPTGQVAPYGPTIDRLNHHRKWVANSFSKMLSLSVHIDKWGKMRSSFFPLKVSVSKIY